jgi:DNA-binding NarL/FixJ family response regulator
MMKPYSIVLADDHQLMREGIRNLINTTKGLQVVGEAGDGLVLLNLLRLVTADLIILDIAMPGLRGIEAAHEIRTRHPGMHILFLSMYKSEEFLSQALAIGARGYLLKEDSSMELLQAIETIRNGQTYWSSRLAIDLARGFRAMGEGTPQTEADPLTGRERQVLKLIAEGSTDRQIGELLFISLRTAQRHHHNIRTKLGIKSTADLVKYAIARGYIAAPS